MNPLTQEYHYQCESCGYYFWHTNAMFGSEVGSPTICDECKRENEHIDDENSKIEADFTKWAEKEIEKPIKHRVRTRAIPSRKKR